jgi:hypothetical protein
MPGDLMKGGLRYKRLRRLVEGDLADEGLEVFFIGTAAPLELTGTMDGRALGALAADEYVIALTRQALHVIEMGGMGVFSAKLAGTVARIPRAEASASLEGSVATVGGRAFRVFPHHDEDARALVDALGHPGG